MDKERYSDPPGLGMGMGLTPSLVRIQTVLKPHQWKAMAQNSLKHHGLRC